MMRGIFSETADLWKNKASTSEQFRYESQGSLAKEPQAKGNRPLQHQLAPTESCESLATLVAITEVMTKLDNDVKWYLYTS